MSQCFYTINKVLISICHTIQYDNNVAIDDDIAVHTIQYDNNDEFDDAIAVHTI